MAELARKLRTLLAENAIGTEEFAHCIGIDIAHAHALCAGEKRLTSTLARQIEQTFCKPDYWLEPDFDMDAQGPKHDLFG